MWAAGSGEEHTNSLQALVTAVGMQKADKQSGSVGGWLHLTLKCSWIAEV